jgi:hypothetical protein
MNVKGALWIGEDIRSELRIVTHGLQGKLQVKEDTTAVAKRDGLKP